jgi:hypothetical protein
LEITLKQKLGAMLNRAKYLSEFAIAAYGELNPLGHRSK